MAWHNNDSRKRTTIKVVVTCNLANSHGNTRLIPPREYCEQLMLKLGLHLCQKSKEFKFDLNLIHLIKQAKIYTSLA